MKHLTVVAKFLSHDQETVSRLVVICALQPRPSTGIKLSIIAQSFRSHLKYWSAQRSFSRSGARKRKFGSKERADINDYCIVGRVQLPIR